jgi:LPS export ABC transporter protein LptC
MGTRRWAQRALALAVIVLMTLFALGVRDRNSLFSALDMTRLAGIALPELLQRIRNFHRVISRDGKRVLEISAKRADYFKDDTTVQVIQPYIVFYEEGEKVGELAGSKGKILLDGNQLSTVSLSGIVILELGDFKLYAEDLVYNREPETIKALGTVEVRSSEVTLTGRDLVINVVERSLTMNEDVHIRLESAQE